MSKSRCASLQSDDSARFQTAGNDCVSSIFSFTTPATGDSAPALCGVNNGLHMYLDAGFGDTSDLGIKAAFSTAATGDGRRWKIKVSQIPCGATYAPPPNCLNYFTGLSGLVKSYNFDATTVSRKNRRL